MYFSLIDFQWLLFVGGNIGVALLFVGTLIYLVVRTINGFVRAIYSFDS